MFYEWHRYNNNKKKARTALQNVKHELIDKKIS